MDWILALDKVNLTKVSVVGGKAARLGALAQAGFAVPDGLVVTADAFRAHLPSYEADAKPPPPRLQAEFLNALANALTERFPQGTQFAVRSSAIDEDGAGASFAGQHATYYYITADRVGEAIVDCWLSLWSDTAIAYRHTWGEPPEPMAVIVQRLALADRSGVSFSEDPSNSQDERTVIESSWGLGAALVDGRVSPDRVLVDRRGRVSCSSIGDKKVYVPANVARHGHERLLPVPESDRQSRTLSDDDAREIAEATEQIEVLFNHPVDVEWAYENGCLQILQARPITTLLAQDETHEALVLFKPVAENFSEPFTPMSEDLFRRVLPNIGQFIRGRFYVRFKPLKALLPFRLNDAELADLVLLRNTENPPLSFLKLPLTALLMALIYLLNGIFWHRSAHLTARSLERVSHAVSKVHSNPDIDALKALKRLLHGRHPFQGIHHFVFQINISSGRYFLLLGLLNKLLERWAPEFDQTQVPVLCHGGNDMFSTQMVDGIAELAQIAGDDPSALDDLARLDDEHPLHGALANFLNTFGHRGAREIELAAPRWQEDPGALTPMIRAQLKAAAAQGDSTDDIYARHLAARDQLHQSLTSRWRRRLVDRLIACIRYYIVLRENTRHYHTMIFATVRRKLLEMESNLLSQRALRCEGDLFFLTWDEAQDLNQGLITGERASQMVRERRIHWQSAAKQKPPDRYNIPTSSLTSAAGELHGICACPGYVIGRARVMLTPNDADMLEPGDILVAPYTDPTWTPLFPSLGGIVVGIGSYLSHAGTIAREYQIPCVVDVAGCTEQIQDGCMIELDAGAGTMRTIEEAT